MSTGSANPRTTVQRVCFQLQVAPDRLDEYRERHAAVWPDMLRAIEASGRRNYSLFLRDDGLLIGYYETDDDEAAQAALESDPRTAPWEAEMAEFFVSLDGARADQGAPRLAEVFHLEDQLAALDALDALDANVDADAASEPGTGPAASDPALTGTSDHHRPSTESSHS
jgi:L-rhamnose mutarotase